MRLSPGWGRKILALAAELEVGPKNCQSRGFGEVIRPLWEGQSQWEWEWILELVALIRFSNITFEHPNMGSKNEC